MGREKKVVIIAGPNGAGKITFATGRPWGRSFPRESLRLRSRGFDVEASCAVAHGQDVHLSRGRDDSVNHPIGAD